MLYKQLIFDVDDTLIDFQDTEKTVLTRLFAQEGWPLTAKAFQDYHDYNQSLWRQLEKDEITIDQLFQRRFTVFAEREWGINIDGDRANRLFHFFWGQTHKLLPGVRAILKTATDLGYELGVLSNGDEAEQVQRLQLAGIADDFSCIMTSQAAGFSKPDPRIFDVFFKKSGFDPEKTVMIGDGLPSDILGANNYHLTSVWYNYRQNQPDPKIKADYTITDYSQLADLLVKWRQGVR